MAQNIVTREALIAAADTLLAFIYDGMIIISPEVVEECAINSDSSNNGDGPSPELFEYLPPDIRFRWPYSNPANIPSVAQQLRNIWKINTDVSVRDYKVVIRSSVEPTCSVVLRVSQIVGNIVKFYPFMASDGKTMIFPQMKYYLSGSFRVLDLTFEMRALFAPANGSLYGLKNGGLVEICTADQILLGMNRSSVAASPANAEASGIMMLSSGMTEADGLDAATSEHNVDSIEPDVDSLEPNVDSLENTEPNNTEEYE